MNTFDANKCNMINMYVANFSFERSEKLVSAGLSVSIQAKVSKEDIDLYRVEITTQLANNNGAEIDENKIYLKMLLISTFRIEDFDDTTEEGKKIVEKELLKRVLPHVTQQITTFTTQPGLSPIFLPVIDVENFKSGD